MGSRHSRLLQFLSFLVPEELPAITQLWTEQEFRVCNGCLAYGHEMAFNRHLYLGILGGGAAASRLPLLIVD